MEVFWCENCNIPVILPKYKSEINHKEYIDIEDEILDFLRGLNYNQRKKLYNCFSKTKNKINKAIENNNVNDIFKHIKFKIQDSDDNAKRIYKFSKKYLFNKLANGNDKQQEVLEDLNMNYAERLYTHEDVGEYNCTICSDEVIRIANDVRPVFKDEKILLEEAFNIDILNSAVWADNSRYIIDGEVANFSKSDLYEIEEQLIEKREDIINKIKNTEHQDDFSSFVKANKSHYKKIDAEAKSFVNNTSEIFPDSFHIVSFSGGKDSTVTSDLVTRALKTHQIMHVFGDTSLEFPTTYEYINNLKSKPNSPPFMTASDYETVGENKDKKFFDLSKKFGPPSRVISWCCTIFKTGPIGNLFRNIAEDNEIFTYYGIRRNESNNRRNYDKISRSPKIAKQMVGSPIIDWKDIDVWLYLLSRGIEFNKAYKYGFTRVGCLYCPNNSRWSEFLLKMFFPDYADKWNEFLVDFARNIGKPDPKVYIKEGNWKARQGGSGLDNENKSNTIVESKPCGLGENAKSYELTKPITRELYELFKPFGQLDFNSGNNLLNEVYIRGEKGKNVFLLQGKIGQKYLKVNIIEAHNHLTLRRRVECQLRKYQSCIDCGACANVCSYNAINTRNGYAVDEKTCVNCMKCIAAFHKGCLVAKTTMDY